MLVFMHALVKLQVLISPHSNLPEYNANFDLLGNQTPNKLLLFFLISITPCSECCVLSSGSSPAS